MDLSVVIPVYNEEAAVEGLHAEIEKALAERPEIQAEIIYVDDGSSDGSLDQLYNLAKTDRRIAIVELSRNFGQTAALYAGFQQSSGSVIVALDGDGQNDPADIFSLVDLLETGYDCVSGWRKERHDGSLSRNLPSKVANWMIARATDVRIHDSGCTLKAYDGELLRSLPIYGDQHRFLPFLIYNAGGRVAELPVNHRPRRTGSSKYGIGRTFRVIQDVLVAKFEGSFSRRPMHFLGNLGASILAIGLLTLLLAVVLKVTGQRDFVATPLPLLGAVFALAGIQLITVGITTEFLLRRLAFQTREKPYRVRKITLPTQAPESRLLNTE